MPTQSLLALVWSGGKSMTSPLLNFIDELKDGRHGLGSQS